MFDCQSSVLYTACLCLAPFSCVRNISLSCWRGRSWSHLWYQIFSRRAGKSWQTEQPASSHTVVCVSVHFNQEKWLCGPHIAHRGGLSVLIVYTQSTVDVVSVSLNQTMKQACKKKPDILFFSLLHFVIPLLSEELAWSSYKKCCNHKDVTNVAVPSSAHLFRACVPVSLHLWYDVAPLFYCWHSAMNVWALCKWRGLNSWQAVSPAPWHTGPHMLCGIMMTLGSSDNIRTHFR